MGNNSQWVADARAGLERVKVEILGLSFDHLEDRDRSFLESLRRELLDELNKTTRLVLCMAIDIHDAGAGGIEAAKKGE